MKKLLCLLMACTLLLGFSSCKAARLEYWGISDLSEGFTDDLIDDSENSIENSEEVSTEPDEFSKEESSEVIIEYTSTPLLWKVTSPDSDGVIWLFGSIHVADESAYPLPDAVMDAFESCDALAVECDITNSDFDTASLYRSMSYKDNTTIDQHISAEVYEAASAILIEAYGESVVENLKHYKPIFWYLLIDELFMKESELTAEFGIDTYFLDLAEDEEMDILEVESVAFQFDMLLNFSDDLQEFLLAGDAFTTSEEYLEGLNALYEAWKSGDLETLVEMNFSEPPTGYYTAEQLLLLEEYNNAMLFDRNVGMTETAEEYLAQDMEVFYVVGEGHMVGDKGVVQLLTEAGYIVEQITSYTYNQV